MRQPTPQKDSNQHTVPPERKEGIMACLLSRGGLCYKEKINPVKEPGELHVVSKYQRRSLTGEEVRSRTWGKKNVRAKVQLGNEDYSRVLHRSAAVTGDNRHF